MNLDEIKGLLTTLTSGGKDTGDNEAILQRGEKDNKQRTSMSELTLLEEREEDTGL